MKQVIMIFSMMMLLISGCSYEQFDNLDFSERPCYGDVEGSPELYYLEYQNWVYDYSECQTGNRTQDEINKKCYEKGRNVNASFDLIGDYGFTCNQIEYINDHFILKAEQKDGGIIEGNTRGLFSYGHIEGKFYDWVNIENLATGKLIKTAKYHLDCKNSTLYWKVQYVCQDGKAFPEETSDCYNGHNTIRDTKILTYYTESDFVMYYVNNCIVD